MPIVNLVGAFFRPPAKFLLEVLPAGSELLLVPEPENPYDENAIAVYGNAAGASHAEASESLPRSLRAAATDFRMTWKSGEWEETSRHLGYVAKDQTASIRRAAESYNSTAPWHAKLSFSAEGKPQVKVFLEENV